MQPQEPDVSCPDADSARIADMLNSWSNCHIAKQKFLEYFFAMLVWGRVVLAVLAGIPGCFIGCDLGGQLKRRVNFYKFGLTGRPRHIVAKEAIF
jgi:hypothetical protein